MIRALSFAVRDPESARWLEAQRGAGGDLAPAFAAAGRRLGRAPIEEADAAAITAAGLRWPVTGVDACGRAALVLAAIDTVADPVAFVRDLIRRGEERERCAVARVLAALPEPARFVAITANGGANVPSVFLARNALMPFLTPIPASFCARTVVGIRTSRTPRWNVAVA